jgi:YggT family protein
MIGFLTLIHYLLIIYIWLIVARALLSWVNPDPYNQLVRWLCRLTDPLLFRIRRTIPMPKSGLDFSPVIALVLITFIDIFVLKTSRDLSMGADVAVVANFIFAFVMVLHDILRVYLLIVIIAAVISWVNPDPYNPIVRGIYGVTEPVLNRIRRVLPMPVPGIDFSPLILIAIIYAVKSFVIKTLL